MKLTPHEIRLLKHASQTHHQGNVEEILSDNSFVLNEGVIQLVCVLPETIKMPELFSHVDIHGHYVMGADSDLVFQVEQLDIIE